MTELSAFEGQSFTGTKFYVFLNRELSLIVQEKVETRMNYRNDNGQKSLEVEFAYAVEMVGYAKLFDEFTESLHCNLEAKKKMGDPNALADALVVFSSGAFAQSIYKGEIYKLLQTISGTTTTELSEILTAELKRFKSNRAIKAFIKIEQRLKDAGIEPRSIDLDEILLPIMQGISNHKDESVQEMYSNLLLTAIAGKRVFPGEIQILDGISTDEILILELLAKNSSTTTESSYIRVVTKLIEEDFKIAADGLNAKGLIKFTAMENIQAWKTNIGYGITKDRGAAEYIGGESLRSADLEAIEASFKATMNTIIDLQTVDQYRSIGLTNMGQSFMAKCKGIVEKSIETEVDLST